MILSQEIEALESIIDKDKYAIFIYKYDNLIQDCAFEDILLKYKHLVAKIYNDAEKYIPIQLNGTIGNIVKKNNTV